MAESARLTETRTELDRDALEELDETLRAQMPRIRRTLKALDGAPKKKITLIVKIG